MVNQADLEQSNFIRGKAKRDARALANRDRIRQQKADAAAANAGAINAISKKESYSQRGGGGGRPGKQEAGAGANTSQYTPWQQRQVDHGCKFCTGLGHYQEICPLYVSAKKALPNNGGQSACCCSYPC